MFPSRPYQLIPAGLTPHVVSEYSEFSYSASLSLGGTSSRSTPQTNREGYT